MTEEEEAKEIRGLFLGLLEKKKAGLPEPVAKLLEKSRPTALGQWQWLEKYSVEFENTEEGENNSE